MRVYRLKDVLIYVPCTTILSLYIVYEVILLRNRVYRFSAVPYNTSYYVCQTFNGRLGNHMFQYASLYGISQLNGLTVLLGRNDDLVKYFEVPGAEIRGSRDVCWTFTSKMARYCCVYDPSFMHLPKFRNYRLGKYLQSWKYFWHVRKEVKEELSFRKDIRESAKNIIANYRDAYSVKYGTKVTIVGVHIRRGDILWDSIQVHGNNVAPDKYIYFAVNYMKKKFGQIVLIVCSDEMNYAKNLFKNISIPNEFIEISPVYDLAVLASCDHVIMTVGTFGWWAGFLSGGTVIYYKYPMREGTSGRIHFNYSDYFPTDWIGLE